MDAFGLRERYRRSEVSADDFTPFTWVAWIGPNLRTFLTKVEAGVTVERARRRVAEGRRGRSGLESDAAGFRSGRLHELTDGIE